MDHFVVDIGMLKGENTHHEGRNSTLPKDLTFFFRHLISCFCLFEEKDSVTLCVQTSEGCLND